MLLKGKEMELGHGAVQRPVDSRDRILEDVIFGGDTKIDIDWEKGYDVRNELGHDIDIKNQQKTSSCVAQAWSYLVELYEMLEVGKFREVSTKAIYSQIFIPPKGGAYIFHGGRIVTSWGSLFEEILPSKTTGGHMTEIDMRDKTWKTEGMDIIAKLLRGKELRRMKKHDLDSYALAILNSKGIVAGLKGANGHGWLTERPKPPKGVKDLWGHALFFGAFGTDEFGKFIATPNSWDRGEWSKEWNPGDAPGKGWQKIYINYLPYMFDAWTYTDIIKEDTNMALKTVKLADKPEIYAVGINNILYHIPGPEAFREGVAMGQWKEEFEVVEPLFFHTKKVSNLKPNFTIS